MEGDKRDNPLGIVGNLDLMSLLDDHNKAEIENMDPGTDGARFPISQTRDTKSNFENTTTGSSTAKGLLPETPPPSAGCKPHESTPFSSKYYKIDDSTKQEFWLRKSTPPPKVEIYPVGHPKNPGVQSVWKATNREITYFDVQRFVVNIVPSKNVHYFEDVLYSGRFVTDDEGSRNCGQYPLTPASKMEHMEDTVAKYGPSVWTRFTETFGSSIAKIVMTVYNQRSGKMRALILAGTNFQGASCIVAARYLAYLNVEVYVCCVTAQGANKEPFPGSTPLDLHYEDIKVVQDLKVLKNQKFHVVIFGVDDDNSPTTTLHVYREWMMGARVVLIEPPIISQSYRGLIDGMCYKKAVASFIINAFRPTICYLNEDAVTFVANIPTNKYPPFGKGDYSLVRLIDRNFRNPHSRPSH